MNQRPQNSRKRRGHPGRGATQTYADMRHRDYHEGRTEDQMGRDNEYWYTVDCQTPASASKKAQTPSSTHTPVRNQVDKKELADHVCLDTT